MATGKMDRQEKIHRDREEKPEGEGFGARLGWLYRQANDATGGRLGILRETVESFGEGQGSEAAAGMAYYAMFSLFPLLLALVAAASFILARETAFEEVVSLIEQAIPVSQELIRENFRTVVELRGPVGLLGLVAALWSASGVFTVLSRNVNQAWTGAEERGFIRNRLVGLSMIGILGLLLVVSLASSMVFRLVGQLDIPVVDSLLWRVTSILLPWLSTLLLFFALYNWVPNTKVEWNAALWGAVFATVAWQLAAKGFTWYLSSGLARYRIIYGSLGSVVILMLWIYLSSMIMLLGAHLSAAVARRGEMDGERRGWE
jgi:membrane protein